MAKTERAFYTLDTELRFVTVGPRALSLWAKSKKEVLGRRLMEVFPNAEGGQIHRALLEALQSLRPLRLRADSFALPDPVDIEIYPVNGLLQVSFQRALASL